MDSTPNWATLISQLGFPIAMCIWFAWRDYIFLGQLKDTLAKIVTLITEIIDKKVL